MHNHKTKEVIRVAQELLKVAIVFICGIVGAFGFVASLTEAFHGNWRLVRLYGAFMVASIVAIILAAVFL